MYNSCKVASLGNIYELIRNGANVNHKAKLNAKTPLYKARTDEVVKILLNHGADPYAKLMGSDDRNTSVIEHLMKFNSDCARAILDNCLSRLQDGKLILDFNVFKPEDSIIKKDDEMAVYNHAIHHERKDLLLHPLMQIYLFMKVRNFKAQYWLQFALKFLCAMAFTYIGVTYTNFNHCKMLENNGSVNADCFTMYNTYVGCHLNETHSKIQNLSVNNIKPIRCIRNTLHPTKRESFGVIGSAMGLEDPTEFWMYLVFLSVVALYLLIREVIELLVLKWEYFKKEENYLQLMMVALMYAFISTSNNDLDTAQHLASWMVFFAWTDITLILGTVDRIGECVYMSIDVMKNMMLCFIIFVPSLFGFSYGFYILINPTESFNSWFGAMVKVMAMGVGELDYTTNFDYHNLDRVGGKNFSSQIMIILFIFGIALVMMNVLLVVTLSKTDDLEKKSKIMQAERMVNEIEISQKYTTVIRIINKVKCRNEFVIKFNQTLDGKVTIYCLLVLENK